LDDINKINALLPETLAAHGLSKISTTELIVTEQSLSIAFVVPFDARSPSPRRWRSIPDSRTLWPDRIRLPVTQGNDPAPPLRSKLDSPQGWLPVHRLPDGGNPLRQGTCHRPARENQ
jgi:antitoxin (DNA-binding transcriptional repressor) of toxin-antitoxin stability system